MSTATIHAAFTEHEPDCAALDYTFDRRRQTDDRLALVLLRQQKVDVF